MGRVGDSPVIGAGLYADNETGAVSATGYGEHLMRAVIAKTISEHFPRWKHASGPHSGPYGLGTYLGF